MIREITSNDKQDFLDMAHEFYASDAVLHPLPDEYHLRAFNEAVNSKLYLRIFIMEYDGKVAGYSTLSKQFCTEAGGFCMWFEDIYVKPQYRSKGLARELFAHVEQNFGYARRLRLEVEEENERAVKLYSKMGFEVLPYMQMVKEKQ
ncbi:MAG: GNAT family N-acetyltransferase [Ruminococcaceae bacterium]|nr:GNAT family N-acetyltransferase [Oscillospiraceae bacterium]